MKIIVTVLGDQHIHYGATDKQLGAINLKLDTIVMNNAELLGKATALNTKLDAANTKIDKITDEERGLVQMIIDLRAIIEAGGAGSTTPEFDAKWAEIEANATGIGTRLTAQDDLVADEPPAPAPAPAPVPAPAPHP